MKPTQTIRTIVFGVGLCINLLAVADEKPTSTNLGLLPSSLAPTQKSGTLPEEELDLNDPSTLLEMEEQVVAAPNSLLESARVPAAEGQAVKAPITPIAVLPPIPETNKGQATDPLPFLPALPLSPANTPAPLAKLGPTPMNQPQTRIPLLSAANSQTIVTPPPPPQAQTPLNFSPVLAGAGLGAIAPPQPAATTQILPVPSSTAMAPLAGVPDIAVILSNNQFFPSKIRLKEGMQTRLIFTTLNKKPAALVIERLQIQRWIAKEGEPQPKSELERSRLEINRELVSTKVTEIVLDPKAGTYSFHDAITGASGEINVE